MRPSEAIDYRNKLVIHAKCVTIQLKDMSLLYDIWHSIDLTSPIGDPTMQRQIIVHAAKIESARQARGVPVAKRQYDRLQMLGHRVPSALKNFLRAHGAL